MQASVSVPTTYTQLRLGTLSKRRGGSDCNWPKKELLKGIAQNRTRKKYKKRTYTVVRMGLLTNKRSGNVVKLLADISLGDLDIKHG